MPISLDPAGHLALAVSDFSRSVAFYRALFTQLGFAQIRANEHSAAWVTHDGFGIWIKPAQHAQPRYTYYAPGLQHLCVKASSRELVDAVHQQMAAHAVVLHAPQAYSEYTPDYYAVFFADPDGLKIEVAFY